MKVILSLLTFMLMVACSTKQVETKASMKVSPPSLLTCETPEQVMDKLKQSTVSLTLSCSF